MGVEDGGEKQSEVGDVTWGRGHGGDIVTQDGGEEAGSGQCGRPESNLDTGERASSGMEEQVAFNVHMLGIYDRVVAAGGHNCETARERVPSGLCVEAWRRWLTDYPDQKLADYLEFGWPINFDRRSPLQPTRDCHPSARGYLEHIDFYVATEMANGALVGPFTQPPFQWIHMSPLMTRLKRDSDKRRVIMDLSWPQGASINDGIQMEWYMGGPATIQLPTVDYMEGRHLELGSGAFFYKTDLARGYRQLRVDPGDWPLLGFCHRGEYFVDVCPPFGLRTSAMCMQRTSEAICWMHGKVGYVSRPYLDDFGGAERTVAEAEAALAALQQLMAELGVSEAEHKICKPARQMVWLGLLYDSEQMTISIPQRKLQEVMGIIDDWQGKVRATRNQMQQLLGLLQFVASVSPPTRVFTNRMLNELRETPKRGSVTLSLEFKKDLKFFIDLLPEYNGVKVVAKGEVECQEYLELDASLKGCGAFVGDSYYGEPFPEWLQQEGHPIAHLELLNVVIALKVWCREWRGARVEIHCDNMNACLAIQSGRSKDKFMQHCVRELFVYAVRFDVELHAKHQPGKELVRADALSRMHADERCRRWVQRDGRLRRARRRAVPEEFFRLLSEV